MEGRRFDTLTKLVVADVSRRGVMKGALAAFAGALLGSASASATSAGKRSAERGNRTTRAMATDEVLQYDPVALVGNVALALADFETTPIAFVLDPQQVVADGHFYGAEPPAGWQGLLRTVLYRPDPNGASGQGFSQALYLKGHWFDGAGNAEAWYGAGVPLVEASGSGRYVDQTGDADFATQRTLWGASFPTADDPNVTINRGIAWFRRGNVVLDVTLDTYCPGGTAANLDTSAHLAAIVPGIEAAAGAARRRAVNAASLTVDFDCAAGTAAIGQLGPRINRELRDSETERTVTHHLPVLVGTPVVNLDVTRWGGQTTRKFGATAEEQARREAFGFGSVAHISGNYAGVDADGNPVAVFTNSWIVEIFEQAQALLGELVDYVAANDERIGAERVEIPRLAASGEGVAVTGNAFTFPQPARLVSAQNETKVGGVEVRGGTENVVTTAAVATPLPPETTPQDVQADFEGRVAQAAREPAKSRDELLAITATHLGSLFGVDPLAVLLGLSDDELARFAEPFSPVDETGKERPPAVGQWVDEAAVFS